MSDHPELAEAFIAYLDSQKAVQNAERDYAEAEEEVKRPLVEARRANKEARNRLAELMLAYGLERIVL